MDSLLSLSDNEIETINPDHELVAFDHIKDYYSPSRDLNVSYLLGSAVTPSSFDWVGLYRRGWTSTNNYITYQWAPKTDVVWHQKGRRRVVIPRLASWELFNINDKFQLLYVTSGGDVIGVSNSFAFGDPPFHEVHLDVWESLSNKPVESFSNNFLDVQSLESLTLSSDSGHSSCAEADQEEDDEDLPVTLAWDDSSLVGDFTGKSWYEELELLREDQVVKEYDARDEQAVIPYMPLLGNRESYSAIDTKNYYAVLCGEDEENVEDDLSVLFDIEDKTPKRKETPLSLDLVPVYSDVPVEFSSLWSRYGIQTASEDDAKEEQEPETGETTPLLGNKSNKPIELPFTSGWEKVQVKDEPLAEEGNGDMSLIPVYDVNRNKCTDLSNADTKKKNMEERVRQGMEIIKSLIASISESSLSRPLSCAPDCIACVVCRLMLGHYSQRLLAAETRAQLLEQQTEKMQKSMEEKKSTNNTNVATMISFVKTAEETIAMMDEALTLSYALRDQYDPEKAQVDKVTQPVGSEKSQQTDAKVIKDASTECTAPKHNAIYTVEDEENGWQVKNTKRINRLKKTIERKAEALQQAEDTIQCQKTQISLYQDVIKDLRRNIREERKHVKTGRQEILKLRRQLRGRPARQPAWGKASAKATNTDVGTSTKAQPVEKTAIKDVSDPPKYNPPSLKSLASSKPLLPPKPTLPSSKPTPATPKPTEDTSKMTTDSTKSASAPKSTSAESPSIAPVLPQECQVPAKPTSEDWSTFAKSLSPVVTTQPTNDDFSSVTQQSSGFSPFYSDKKAFRQYMNQQIKEGRCRMCGMNFSNRADRRLIEEHIVYHLQFNF